MQDFNNKVLKVNDYSKEKDDLGTNSDSPSLLSPNNKDARWGTVFHPSNDTRGEAGLLWLVWKLEFSKPGDKLHNDSGDGGAKGPS